MDDDICENVELIPMKKNTDQFDLLDNAKVILPH